MKKVLKKEMGLITGGALCECFGASKEQDLSIEGTTINTNDGTKELVASVCEGICCDGTMYSSWRFGAEEVKICEEKWPVVGGRIEVDLSTDEPVM